MTARTLADFRGCHAGQAIVVCGCGPSLRDLPDPRHWVTIGVNDVGRLFDPTYLVVVNPPQQFAAERFAHVRQSRAQVLFTQLDLGPVAPPVVRFALGRRAGTDDGGGQVLHYTQNSPYVAVGLAAWMGAARIGLIGVDLGDDHFFGATGRHPLAARWAEIDREYGALAAALRGRGVELVNLSRRSRLVSLPAGELRGELRREARPAPPPAPPAPRPRPAPLTVAVDRTGGGVVGALLDTLAGSIAALGHRVVRARGAVPGAALVVAWNGRHLRTRLPVLYCEHGWLPRAHYQISPRGINADSHAAPFRWDGQPLAPADAAALDARLRALRPDVAREAGAALPPRFVLLPLQIESDTNIVRHAPPALRTMQALIDHVSRCDPPWPMVVKQHPADARHGRRHLALRLRRPQDRLWPHDRGDVHAMLASGRCAGVVTINSNVAHDSLLWEVPAVVLGRNVWPPDGEVTPFLTALPRDWQVLARWLADDAVRECRRAYARHLIRHQWTLDDARDPARVARLLDGCTARAATSPRAAPAPVRVPVRSAVRTHTQTLINVVAKPRGWLFAHWQQQLVRARLPGVELRASALPHADVWIFVRAREADGAPDPARSVVQLHDLLGHGRGGLDGPDGRSWRDGERGAVWRCGALSLTHPRQRELLEAQGLALATRRCVMQPVGHSAGPPAAPAPHRLPIVAWVGRPAMHDGLDASGLEAFVDAASGLRGKAEVRLVGERLDAAAAALRQAGVAVRVLDLTACPIGSVARWLPQADLLVCTSTADAGPWPLFDALAAGVPVLAPPVGWAEALLADGRCGRLAADAPALGLALREMVSAASGDLQAWRRAFKHAGAERVAAFTLDAWVRANVELALSLLGRCAAAGLTAAPPTAEAAIGSRARVDAQHADVC